MTDGEESLNGDEDGAVDTASKSNLGKGEKVGDWLEKISIATDVHRELRNTKEQNGDPDKEYVKRAEISKKQMKVSLELLVEEIKNPNAISYNAKATRSCLPKQITFNSNRIDRNLQS